MKLLQSFKNWRLGSKGIVAVVLAFVLLQVVASTIGRVAVGRLTVQVGQNRAGQEAAVIQNQFEKAEQDVLAAAKLLSSRPGLIEAVVAQDVTAIKTVALVGATPLNLDEVNVFEPEGAHIVAVLEEGDTLHVAQQAPLVSFARLGIETTGVLLDKEESTLWLAAAVPLRDTSGAIVGILLASHRADDMFLEEINFSRADVHLALVADGQILAQDFPTPELLGEFSPALLDEAVGEQVVGGQTVVADDLLSISNGTPYALAYAPLVLYDDTVATIGVAVDLGQLRVFQRQLIITVAIAFGVLGLVVIFSLSLFVRYGAARPLSRLQSVVEGMASGDYGQRAQVTTRDEIGLLAEGVNVMAARLQETLENLERQGTDLQRRALQMQASAEVGRAASSILDTDRLIQHVVDLIRERFGLYYVGLFLVDETGKWAVLRAGTGEAGQAMLARGHQIAVGEGMIGWSISQAEARVAEEVGVDAVHLATSELPDTRSEAALALRSRGRVLGALTVQSDRPGVFDEESVAVLQSMADQVAVAIDNAGLFAESRAALEAARRAYGELSQQAWDDLLYARPDWGYSYNQSSVTPVKGELRPEMLQAEQTGQIVQSSQSSRGDGADGPVLAVPLQVRGQVIGVLGFRKREEDEEWSASEISLMEMLTEQLGQALESARLYRDTQRRAARERLIGEITARVRETFDMETVLKVAAQELCESLRLPEVVIRLATGREGEK